MYNNEVFIAEDQYNYLLQCKKNEDGQIIVRDDGKELRYYLFDNLYKLENSKNGCIPLSLLTLSCADGNKEEAMHLISIAEEHCLRTDNLKLAKGDLSYAMEDYQLANENWLSSNGGFNQVYERAMFFFNIGEFEDAQTLLINSIEYKENNNYRVDDLEMFYITLGNIAFQNREWEDVTKYFNLALDCSPNIFNGYIYLAQAYREIGQNQKSLGIINIGQSVYKKLYKTQSINEAALLEQKGATLEKLGDIDHAIIAYNQALALFELNNVDHLRIETLRQLIERLN